jgi:hypothetical protein
MTSILLGDKIQKTLKKLQEDGQLINLITCNELVKCHQDFIEIIKKEQEVEKKKRKIHDNNQNYLKRF